MKLAHMVKPIVLKYPNPQDIHYRTLDKHFDNLITDFAELNRDKIKAFYSDSSIDETIIFEIPQEDYFSEYRENEQTIENKYELLYDFIDSVQQIIFDDSSQSDDEVECQPANEQQD
jgi:hypothetical protein